MRSNITTIPCPKCKRPNPVEARICGCGYWFMKEPGASEQGNFPALHVLMPDIQANLARKASIKTPPRQETVQDAPEMPVRETPAIKPEPVAAVNVPPIVPVKLDNRTAEERGLPVFREISAPRNGASRGRRLRMVVSAGTVVLLLIAAGVWGGAFDRFRTQQPASSFVALPPADEHAEKENNEKEADRNAEPEMSAVNTSQPEEASEQNTVAAEEGARQPATTERNVTPTGRTEQRQTTAIPAENTSASAIDNDVVELVPVPVTPKPAEAQPPKAANKAVPVARCNDGTYSYRSSRGEVCGQRGGVAEMLGSGGGTKNTAPVENRTYILGPRGGCYYLSKSGAKVYVDKKFCN
ncbi:MAG: hypothetical protein KF855_09495 [Acidobacteria bacterium]|nr:hypothetical protein [Acidobacteriota bacterium]